MRVDVRVIKSIQLANTLENDQKIVITRILKYVLR